jgi:formylmethanofuran dehydrogenase subunit A
MRKKKQEVREYRLEELINQSKEDIYLNVEKYFFNDKEKLALDRSIKIHCEKMGLKGAHDSIYSLLKDKITKALKRKIHNDKDSWIRTSDE